MISETVIALANFVEDKYDATWTNSKAKILDYLHRGVGLRGERVTESQLKTLQDFINTGVTFDEIRKKSSAAACIVQYLTQMLTLQEHLLAKEREEQRIAQLIAEGGLPETESVDNLAVY